MEGHATDTRLAEARAIRGGGGPGAVRQALAAVEAALRESGAAGAWGGGGGVPPLRNASPLEKAGTGTEPSLVRPSPAVLRAVEEPLAEALDDAGWVILQVRADGLTCGGVQVAGVELAEALAAIDVASMVFWGAGPAEAAALVALVRLARAGNSRASTRTGAGVGALAAWRAAHLVARIEATPGSPRATHAPTGPDAAAHSTRPQTASPPGPHGDGELGTEARERLRVLRHRPSAFLGRLRLVPPPPGAPQAPHLADTLARLLPHARALAARTGAGQVQPGDLAVLTLLLDAIDADPSLRETCVRAGAARRGLTARLDPHPHAAWCFTWWGLTLPEHLSEVGQLAVELAEAHAGIVHDAFAARPAVLPALPPSDVPGLVAYLELAARLHDLAGCAEGARSLGHGDARVRMAALRAWAHARPADDARVSALAARDPDPRVRATARSILSGAP